METTIRELSGILRRLDRAEKWVTRHPNPHKYGEKWHKDLHIAREVFRGMLLDELRSVRRARAAMAASVADWESLDHPSFAGPLRPAPEAAG
ncbi:hypothetical protein AB0C52_24000 [Streptomyces sp. NPDC048717]|uniref:hypothetical protein n=1 Tax=Streptomyces sp. NPDC048717 TaxID=3154928 RepID=UPI003441D44F